MTNSKGVGILHYMTKLQKPKKGSMPPEVKDYFKAEGKKGGQKTLQKHGLKYFKMIGTIAAKKRWANHKKKSKKDTPS